MNLMGLYYNNYDKINDKSNTKQKSWNFCFDATVPMAITEKKQVGLWMAEKWATVKN